MDAGVITEVECVAHAGVLLMLGGGSDVVASRENGESVSHVVTSGYVVEFYETVHHAPQQLWVFFSHYRAGGAGRWSTISSR